MMPETEVRTRAIERPFRVLSLDSGAKGVYTLVVLKEVEAIADAPWSNKKEPFFYKANQPMTCLCI